MRKHPKLVLSRLRDIGWRLWDPIGLGDLSGCWQTYSFADEYDSYLVRAAGMVRRNEDQAAVDFLVYMETHNMGMDCRANTYSRATATVAALRSDKKIWKEA